jgi:hypothetical protein
MFLKLSVKLALVIAMCAGVGAITGCAIGGPSSDNEAAIKTETRQHPASYFIDRFQVEKELPAHKESNVPFFFKKCSNAGEGFPSRTSYDCDYPF